MAVRRIDLREETHQLGFLPKMYGDELVKIAETLREVGALTIKCDGLEATEPSDFDHEDMPLKPRLLTMTAAAASGGQEVRVELGRRIAELVITEPTTMTEGVRARIQRICRITPLYQVYNGWGSKIIFGSYMAILSAWVGINGDLAGAGLLAALLAVFSSIDIYGRRGRVVIINDWRRNRPSFFRRTRDDWAVEAIMMLLGLLIGYILGRG